MVSVYTFGAAFLMQATVTVNDDDVIIVYYCATDLLRLSHLCDLT